MLFYDYLTDFIFTENVPENADIILSPEAGMGKLLRMQQSSITRAMPH